MPDRKLSTRERLRVINRLQTRTSRVRKRFFYILQATIGAGLAYAVAHLFFGHEQPFFAPMAVVIILGLSGGSRLSRAVELSMGGVFGVAVGTLLVHYIGSGPFQITLVVGIALLVASFLSKSPLLSNQMVIGCILIATILPPETAGGFERIIDALIGSSIGLATIAFLPSSALSEGRTEIRNVLAITASVLSDVSRGLKAKDPATIQAARDAVRGTQGDINRMLEAAKSGRETINVSPWLRAQRRQINSMERILAPVDNCIRGVRVMSRRALVLAEDGDVVSDRQVAMIDELADIAQALSNLYDKNAQKQEAQEIPALIHRLRVVGAQATMDVVEEKNLLNAYAILAQTRSAVVDLLMVCGMSRESAIAALAPTSAHPAFPPEVIDVPEGEEL